MPRLTEHGLISGAAEVVCVAEINGYSILWVQTKHKRIQVVTTPKGRKITVNEMLPPRG